MTSKGELLGSVVSLASKRIERSILDQPDGGQYGVFEKDSATITIRLGVVPAFDMPKQTATKFAIIILKKCGVHIDFGPTAGA